MTNLVFFNHNGRNQTHVFSLNYTFMFPKSSLFDTTGKGRIEQTPKSELLNFIPCFLLQWGKSNTLSFPQIMHFCIQNPNISTLSLISYVIQTIKVTHTNYTLFFKRVEITLIEAHLEQFCNCKSNVQLCCNLNCTCCISHKHLIIL